jgi:hypothetical protein
VLALPASGFGGGWELNFARVATGEGHSPAYGLDGSGTGQLDEVRPAYHRKVLRSHHPPSPRSRMLTWVRVPYAADLAPRRTQQVERKTPAAPAYAVQLAVQHIRLVS